MTTSFLEGQMIREPVVAGQFYPSDKTSLSKMVDDILQQTPDVDIQGKAIGIVVPHAGYPYSGPTAAHGYKTIAGRPVNTVILLGPTHRSLFDGATVYAKGSWKTPLGNVMIDEKLAQEIIKQDPIIKNLPDAHREEHSLEVQIPFLQRIFNEFKIIPIILLEPSFDECKIIAHAIANNIKDKNVLLVASSDLYHGYSYSTCKKTDSMTLKYIENYDPPGLYRALKQETAQACGGYPIVVLMLVSQILGADK
jgi:AmmeMemoRadiSam system protein B